MSAIATPALRDLLVALLGVCNHQTGRKAVVARAMAADEFLLLREEDRKVLNQWLGNFRKPPAGCRQVAQRLLREHFPR